MDRLNHNLPRWEGETAAAAYRSDEMELVTRLIENSNESIVISQDWRIIYVNKRCADMAGLTKQDMIGLPFLDITHPDDRQEVKERYVRILSGEWFSSGTTVRGLDKDGNTRWAELREIPFSWHGRPAVMSLVNDITDHKRAEEALAQSERKYRQLVETVDEGIGAMDEDGRIVFINPRMAEIFGRTVDEMLGRPLVSLLAEEAEEVGMVEAPRKPESHRHGIREGYEARARRKDGTEIVLSVRSSQILDDDGKYAGEIAAVHDITERKRAEAALTESERHYRFLADNMTDVIWITDLNLKPSYFSPSVTDLLGYSVEEALSGTLDTRVTLDSAKIADQIFAEALSREREKPGTTTSKTVVLELMRKDGSTVWAETTVSFIRNTQGEATGVLGTIRDMTSRKKAEEALIQSQTKYKNLFEHTLLGLEVIDGQTGKTVLANRSLARMFGFKSPADMVGTDPLDYVLPEDTEWVVSQIAQLMTDPSWANTAQIRARTEDGRMIWVTGMGTPIEYEGRPAMLLSLVDMTAAKEAESRLQASEERYRLVVENATEAITVVQDGMLRFVNPKFAMDTGYSEEDLVSKPFVEFVHPDDRQMMADYHVRRLKGEEVPQTYQFRFLTKAGNTRWAEINAVLFDWEGRPATLGLISDITDRTKADEALKAKEERFRTIIENARDAITILDENFGVIYESPSLSAVTGYSPEEWVGKSLVDMQVHPDDIALLASEFERLKSQPGLVIEDTSVRYKHGDGTWHVIEATARNLLDDPRVKGIVVNFRDITERKRAEEALLRIGKAVESSSDAIGISDAEGHHFYNNKAFTDLFEYAAEELEAAGGGPAAYADQDVAHQVFKSITSGASWSGEVEMVSKSGRRFPVLLRADSIKDDAGEVIGLVVVHTDITARRRMEEALRESELRYRLLAENASDVIFTSDTAMRLTYVSPSIRQLTGYSPEETMSRDIDSWVAPASRDFALKAFSWALSRARSGTDLPQALRTATLELPRKDGGTVWAEIRIDFLRDAGSDPTGILGVARDITDRRIAEMELEHRAHLETLITEISTAFIGISTDCIDQGIQNALESISGFTGVDCSHLFILNEDGTRMDLAHEWRSKETEAPASGLHSIPVSSVPWLAAKVRQAACVHIPELKDLPAGAEAERILFQRQGMQSVVVVPMVQSGNAIGFVSLGSVRGKKTWGEETMMLLRLVAEMFSNALERKRMDLALRESEKRYRLLAENITDVIWTTDMQTNITYMSPSATRLVGFSAEELRKMTVADLLTPDSFERGMQVLAERQAKESQEPGSQPDYWTIQVEMRHKDGSTVWVEETVTFLRDDDGTPIGLVGASRDVSRRKIMEDALRMSEDKYRTLVEASPDGVLSIDAQGIITDCNTGLCRMLGYERKQLCGTDARLLGTRKDLDLEPYYRAHLTRGEFMEIETEMLRHDGQALPVWAKLVRLAQPSTADIQTIVYFRDIADRRKIDEMKDEFVGLVSHELRSPLTVIIGALHTAISEGSRLSQKETRQLLEDAVLEAEQLSHLVGNLLELSRAQANRLFLHVEPINMAKAIHKVIGSIERQSSKHKFIVDLPRKLPPVSADQLRLERILYNLLENSVKYSPEGSEITVSAKRDAGQLVVSVSDQGPGISKEDQAKLFKPFQQLGDPMLDHTKGAGLGLLVCRRLVEAHGGRIWVESEPGHGASFRFTLEASNRNGPEAG
ncbi:MAG: PAS domain S-box protein [Dehalococcoidia bacterium]|nr:PAS domain S-box protein [Dehalococcoidia bacterium]